MYLTCSDCVRSTARAEHAQRTQFERKCSKTPKIGWKASIGLDFSTPPQSAVRAHAAAGIARSSDRSRPETSSIRSPIPAVPAYAPAGTAAPVPDGLTPVTAGLADGHDVRAHSGHPIGRQLAG